MFLSQKNKKLSQRFIHQISIKKKHDILGI